METWQDFLLAKSYLLAETIGRLRVLADESRDYGSDAARLRHFMDMARETAAAYDALSWPAATPAAIAGMAQGGAK